MSGPTEVWLDPTTRVPLGLCEPDGPKPVAWRWRWTGGDWHYGTDRPAFQRDLCGAPDDVEPLYALPPISLDGPNQPDEHRLWLARQLVDSKLDDETAYGIVAWSPAVQDLLKANPDAGERDR